MISFDKAVDTIHKPTDLMSFLVKLGERTDSDNFRVINLANCQRRLALWQEHLPNVTPFYAIKTNHDKLMVAEYAALGMSFDCASIREVSQIMDLAVSGERIIFANPYKSQRTIEFLKERGVKRLVFDCEDELRKILQYHPSAELVLRIATDDAHSLVRLSSKFGASLATAKQLVDQVAAARANLVGVSFHVGSNCAHPPTYQSAVRDATTIMRYGRERYSLPLTLLDIGGGFPGASDDIFVNIARAIEETCAALVDDDVTIIAEPGNFFAGQNMTAMVRVIGRKISDNAQDIFLASGIYGVFFLGYFLKYQMQQLARYGWQFQPLIPQSGELLRTTLWGPTCDSADKIVEEIWLPPLNCGSWIYTHNIGSYSSVIETDFNQIDRSQTVYVRV